MKKENSTLRNRLKQYSALAGSMVAVAGVANSQVVYTDIPDTVFTAVNPFPGDTLALDLNNDGITDFNFVGWKSSTYVAFGLIMHPYATTNPNGIVGSVVGPSSNPLGMVSELALNENIDSNQNFFVFNDLTYSTGQNHIPVMFSATPGYVSGDWQLGGTDHYAGFKFSVVANSYFGWARVDVAYDGSSITIKDYAYNATPDEPLFAGQGSPLGVSSVKPGSNFNILGYEGVANIFVNDGKTNDCIVTVTNMVGKTIIRQPLTDRTTRIDLNQYSKGIYLISVDRGNERFSKKISFR